MARDFFINGETLVLVKGRADSGIGSLSQLGLATDAIRVRIEFRHEDIMVDAWGKVPPEIQCMGGWATISMNLIHFDRQVMATCVAESYGGGTAEGVLVRAGARMGNNGARFAAGLNHYISLNLTSPVGGGGVGVVPWRFYSTYLASPMMEFPLGTEKSIVSLQWRAIPYTTDPYGGGTGALGTVLFDHILDN